MPYIKKNRRKKITFKEVLGIIKRKTPKDPGELNYAITVLILDYIYTKKFQRGDFKYQDINDVLGALEGAKLEFYRRFAAEYENLKIKENGDVYT